MRQDEEGWEQIGLVCSAGRRSLWIRIAYRSPEDGHALAIELCSGREGDDAYVKLTPENPQWHDLEDVLLRVPSVEGGDR